jgi:6-phosphogluconolactonase
MRFWVGGDTAEMEGSASGIGELLAGEAGSPLAGGPLNFAGTAAATGGSPSWLAAHPALDVVYAALEGAGAVQAFRRVSDSRLVRHGAPVAVGERPCHVAVAPDSGSLIVSCGGDGAVVRVGVRADGRLGDAAAGAGAVDPYAAETATPADAGEPLPRAVLTEFSRPADLDLAAAARALREAAGEEFAHLVPDYDVLDLPEPDAAPPAAPPGRVSRAHQARYLPGGLIATTDTGFDAVRFWRVVEGSLRAVGTVRLPLGSGPRHTVWHPSGHLYVVTERSREVFVLAPDESRAWRIVGGTPLSRETPDGDLAAELSASADGAFLYAGVRGSDTLATLRVRGAGEALEPIALSETGVTWPRHHVIARDTVLVAGQRSETIATLTLDQRSGVPGRPVRRVEVPSPTCLLPAR